ncbi:hypothetical protein ATERTT37_001584 [Aspergillus terreus]
MLFSPDETSPEASDEIALWLSDEFTQALLLLIALTPASEEFQKLVAFENAFELIFALIEAEGALSHGSEVVEDCLSLLANLLRLNISNQSYFRETGCVKNLTKLLADANQEQESEEPTPQWTLAARDKNIWGLLVIVQLFLVRGAVNTAANQLAFWNNGIMVQALSVAFGQKFSVNVTSKALATCADLIRGNQPLQEQFGDVEVVWGSQPAEGAANGVQRINVIEALLKLSLEPAPIQFLDARLAACECVKAFFTNHSGIRIHVLRRAIDGHISGQDQIPNILTVLLTPPESRGNADPYQTWMASVLLFHLLFENAEAKSIAMGVTEGDAENGEEVITCIQTIVGNLITGMQRGDDERISLGYLMLLCGWLFEEPDAVNDFLQEGSSIQSLLQEIKHRNVSNVLLSGLSTVLLGIVYEFSSKDSPIPRKTLHKLLIEQLGREQYIDKITRLREAPPVRDFEVLPQTVGGQYEGGLPDIFFDRMFVDFLKDNFGRLIRAIDREPGLEISVITNGVERGVSRELVDSLKADLEEKLQLLQKMESDILILQNKFEHEQLEHRKTKESTTMEASKVQQAYEALQRSHEQELSALEEQHQFARNELLKQHGEQLRAIDRQLKETSSDYERKSQKVREHHEAEVADFQKKIRSLESEIARIKDQNTSEVASLNATIQTLKADADKAKQQHVAEILDLQGTIQELQSELNASKERHAAEVSDLNKNVQKLQSEINSVEGKRTTEVSSLNETVQKLQSEVDAGKAKHEAELAELKSENESLQKEVTSIQEKSVQDIEAVREEYSTKCSALEKKVQEAESKANTTKDDTEKSSKALEEMRKELEKARSAAKEKEETRKALEETRQELEKARSGAKEREDTQKALEETRQELEKAKSKAKEKQEADKAAQSNLQALEELRKELEKAKSEAKEKEEARKAAQSELEDLLIVFGDLEAKRNEDKKRLKDLGQEVSEAEDDDDDDDDDEEEDED